LNNKFSEKRIAFYTVRDRIGEVTLYLNLKKLADEEGYDYVSVRFSEELQNFVITAHFYHVTATLMNYLFKPKFNLSVTHHVKIIPSYGYNITYLNMPQDSLYTADGVFQKRWNHLYNYDAYADIHTLVHGKNELLQGIIDKNQKIIPFYIAYNRTEYEKLKMDKALITGSLWGCNRGALRTKLMLKKLAEEDLLVAIGMRDYFAFLGKAFKGSFEKLGKMPGILAEKEKEYGISLLIHSQEHMLEGIPTSRLFEAVANGALAISDQHYFIRKNFGDNVLYFDAFDTTENMYKQIKEHIIWARNNPDLVHEKTKRAHEIFVNNFSMDKQMEKLWSSI